MTGRPRRRTPRAAPAPGSDLSRGSPNSPFFHPYNRPRYAPAGACSSDRRPTLPPGRASPPGPVPRPPAPPRCRLTASRNEIDHACWATPRARPIWSRVWMGFSRRSIFRTDRSFSTIPREMSSICWSISLSGLPWRPRLETWTTPPAPPHSGARPRPWLDQLQRRPRQAAGEHERGHDAGWRRPASRCPPGWDAPSDSPSADRRRTTPPSPAGRRAGSAATTESAS